MRISKECLKWSVIAGALAFILGFVFIYLAALACHHPNPPLIAVLSGCILFVIEGALAVWSFRKF
jgi:protein-S-isoprenylcysteine O-methyltransferase Ste14